MKFRRMISFMCATGLAFSSSAAVMPLPCAVFAEEGDLVYNGWKYIDIDGEVIITGYTSNPPAKLVIPAEIDGLPVTRIGLEAFYNSSSLISVIIPKGVKSIDTSAFCGCSSLTSVTIPDSVEYIGFDAFFGCESLIEVAIPDSVTFIYAEAFCDCTSLNSIMVSPSNENYASKDGVLFNKDFTQLVQYPIGNNRAQYMIPDSVTSIFYEAFCDCKSLTSVTVLDNVTNIENEAFSGCENLTMKGYTGSYVETYAKENNIPFIALDAAPALEPGDVSGDGKVGADDAQLVLQAYVNTLAGKPDGFTDAQKTASDVNDDGKIGADDAQFILQYYINHLAGKDTPWKDIVS